MSKHKSFIEEFIMEYYPDPYGLVTTSYTPDFSVSLSQQPYETLVNTADALAQFIAHLQYYGNKISSEASKLRAQFDWQVEEEISKLVASKAITDRTSTQVRKARALEHNPKLKDIERDAIEKEGQAMLFRMMPNVVTEHLNVIKLEIRTRQQRGIF